MNKIVLSLAILISLTLFPVTTFSDDDDDRKRKRSIPVKVTNMPKVTVKNPQVTIENDETNPVPVNIIDGGGSVSPRQIFTESQGFTFSSPETGTVISYSPVPDGKVLVVETINCQMAAREPQALTRCTFLDNSFGLQNIQVSSPVIKSSGSFIGSDFLYTGLFSGRIYVLPNATPTILVDRQTTGAVSTVGVSISGYLIDATSPSLSP